MNLINEHMKTIKSTKYAISLIVLVITIIVMIVLAGAVILTLNNSGIISETEKAVEDTNLATVKQIAQLGWAEAYAQYGADRAKLEEGVIDALAKYNIEKEKYRIRVTTSGVKEEKKTEIPETWATNIVDIVEGVPIPKGFVISPYEGEDTKNGGMVIYELAENETKIPYDETQYDSWTKRNQYVWVPVEDFSKFVRGAYNKTTYSNTLGSGYWEVVLDAETNMPLKTLQEQGADYMSETTLTEVQAMYESVKEYRGFYVARYEAGLNKKRTSSTAEVVAGKENVHSKMNKIPYNNINWSTSNGFNQDDGGAVYVARNLYPNNNTNATGVISTLIYGVEWDAILQWYISTGAMTLEQINKSSMFGNYKDHILNTSNDLNKGALVWDYSSNASGAYVEKDSMLLDYPKNSGIRWVLSTGALKAAKINNIYDMAGNMFELTMESAYMESSSSNVHVGRGSCFYHEGNKYTIKYRSLEGSYTYTGFRTALYIKK